MGAGRWSSPTVLQRDGSRATWTKNVLFALVPTILLFGIAELVLRIVSPPWMFCLRTHACPHLGGNAQFMTQRGHNFSLETGEPLLVYHPRLFWRQRPNVQGHFWQTPAVSTNALGFREGPVDASGKRTVLVVGDSVSWGLGVPVEARFSNRAASEVALRAGYDDVQFINASVVGYSSFQVLQSLRDARLKALSPRVVVICAGVNDCWRTTTSDREQYEKNTRLLSRVKHVLMHSDLFLFLNRYGAELATWLRTGRDPKGFSFLFGETPGPLRVVRNSPEEAADNLERAGDLAEAVGADVVLLLQHVRGRFPRNWVPEAFWRERRLLAAVARRRKWATVEIAALGDPPLEMPPDRCLLDFCHLTPEAHEIVGHLVASAVLAQLAPR